MSTMNYIATSDELTSVADAIRTKGGTSSLLEFPDGFISAIEDIPTGVPAPKVVNFFDYDGTLVDSYTAEEFAALSALPANPSHEGLTAQGWNWSLSDAQTYVASYGKLDIGQTYITDDGKTRIHIKLEDGRLAPYLGIAINGSADVDWGDGSTHSTVTGSDLTTVVDTQHTYVAAGEYVISIDVTGEAALFGNSSKGSSAVYKGSSSLTYTENEVYHASVLNVELGGHVGIGDYAFMNCCSLTSITIPSSVTSIGSYAFQNCRSLTSITIPSGVTSIGSYAFNACNVLASITIPNSVTSIGSYAFQNSYSITSVTLPSEVTSIAYSAFQNCYSLTSITLPSEVTSIGDYAFNACYSLTSVTIPSGVTSIGSSAFNACYSLTSITVPSGVTSISMSAFQNCYSLTSITLPSEVTSIGNYAFQNCYSLTSVDIPSSVTSIGNSAFAGCYVLASVTIPSSVTSIGSSAFNGCRSLKSISIQGNVTSIGNNVFDGCNSLTSVTLPNSVTSIGGSAFNACFSLTSITIPSGVTSIGNSAFVGCYVLASITIPSEVTSIGSSAFGVYQGQSKCAGLSYILFEPTTPPTVANANAFSLSSDCSIIVPFSALAAYLSAGKYPAPATYTYMGFATYNSGETLPTQDSTEAYNVTWYASKADALAQTNPITEGTGSEIYCRYAAA